MKWPWLPPRGADIFAFGAVVAIGCVLVLIWIWYPAFQQPVNAGFGPDWECTSVPKGGPICVKKLPPAQR